MNSHRERRSSKNIRLIKDEETSMLSPTSTSHSPINTSVEGIKNMDYQKNTMSTLLGSIKSSESVKDRLIDEKVKCFEKEYQGKKSVIF